MGSFPLGGSGKLDFQVHINSDPQEDRVRAHAARSVGEVAHVYQGGKAG